VAAVAAQPNEAAQAGSGVAAAVVVSVAGQPAPGKTTGSTVAAGVVAAVGGVGTAAGRVVETAVVVAGTAGVGTVAVQGGAVAVPPSMPVPAVAGVGAVVVKISVLIVAAEVAAHGYVGVPVGQVVTVPTAVAAEAGVSVNYLTLAGNAGDHAESPDSAALSITGDIDVRVKCALADWTPAATTVLASKWLGTFAWRFIVLTDGRLFFDWEEGGTVYWAAPSNTATPCFADGAAGWVRATLDVTNGTQYEVKFYTSTDGTVWTPFGATVTGTTGPTNMVDTGAPLAIGADIANGIYAPVKIYRVQVLNGIAGTTVFDANFAGTQRIFYESISGALVAISGTGAVEGGSTANTGSTVSAARVAAVTGVGAITIGPVTAAKVTAVVGVGTATVRADSKVAASVVAGVAGVGVATSRVSVAPGVVAGVVGVGVIVGKITVAAGSAAGVAWVGGSWDFSADTTVVAATVAGIGGVNNPVFPDRTVIAFTVIGISRMDSSFGAIGVPVNEIGVLSNICHGIDQ
jgi:hypothetical protein